MGRGGARMGAGRPLKEDALRVSVLSVCVGKELREKIQAAAKAEHLTEADWLRSLLESHLLPPTTSKPVSNPTTPEIP